jgi:hypothetical protein
MSLRHFSILLVLGILVGVAGDAFGAASTDSGSPQCAVNETKHCTLGPPPVCSCVPVTATTSTKARGAKVPADAGGTRQRQ